MKIDSFEPVEFDGKVFADFTLPRSKIVLQRKDLALFNEKLQQKLMQILLTKYRFPSGVHPFLSAPVNTAENTQEVTLSTFHIELAGNPAELPPTNTLEDALKDAIRFATNSVRAANKRISDSTSE